MNLVDDIIFSEQGATEDQFKVVNEIIFNSKYKFDNEKYSKFNIEDNALKDFLKQGIGLNMSLIFKVENQQ